MAFTPIEQNSVGNLVVIHPRGSEVNMVHIINPNAATEFVQFFDANTTTGITLGTTVARYSLQVGTSSSVEAMVGADALFLNGIAVACTTTVVGSTTAAVHVRVWVQ